MARHPVVVVMDADLSHPPEKIPDMILALEAGQQLVIGSRYVPGASTDDTWGFFRWLNSQVATLLARPLTSCHDPMAGFFVLRKAELKNARGLNPIGYKIALELIVKCGLENVGEVPIHFADRRFGKSKLTFKEQLRYLQHLRRLYIHRYFNISSAVQYLAVGASGVVVNLAVLTGLVALSVPEPAAIAGGILVSLVSNFALNRRFSFSYARDGSIVKQFLGFVTACSVGIVINYAVSLAILRALPDLPVQAARSAAWSPASASTTSPAATLSFAPGSGTPPPVADGDDPDRPPGEGRGGTGRPGSLRSIVASTPDDRTPTGPRPCTTPSPPCCSPCSPSGPPRPSTTSPSPSRRRRPAGRRPEHPLPRQPRARCGRAPSSSSRSAPSGPTAGCASSWSCRPTASTAT